MSDAEATIKHCILAGIIQNWHKKDHEDYAHLTREEIFERIFMPHTVWAIEEYLEELKNKNR